MRLFAFGGVMLALSVLVLASAVDPARRPTASVDLVVWLLATAVGAFATVSLGKKRPALSMDLPILLACAFVLGPITAGAIALLAVTTSDEVRGRVAPSRVAWNHAQTSLSVVAGGYAFIFMGGDLGVWPIALFAALGALIADASINYAAVAFLMAVSERQPMGLVLRRMSIGSPVAFGVCYLAFGLISILIAEAYVTLGAISLVISIAPVLLAREVFVSSHRLEDFSRQLRARTEALMRVDERIADERRDERSRIAEALHDEVLQALYTVTLRAHVIREDYRSGRLLDLEDDVPAVIESAEKAAAELRDKIYGLRRASVGHAGLLDTVALLITHLHDESGIVFVPSLDSGVRAEPAVELLVYQVIREALTNVVRHSQAEMAWVSLRVESASIHLEVLDNGSGFDPFCDRDDRHFGLDLMRERAEATGGSLEIRSNPEGGTCVEAWFPQRLAPT